MFTTSLIRYLLSHLQLCQKDEAYMSTNYTSRLTVIKSDLESPDLQIWEYALDTLFELWLEFSDDVHFNKDLKKIIEGHPMILQEFIIRLEILSHTAKKQADSLKKVLMSLFQPNEWLHSLTSKEPTVGEPKAKSSKPNKKVFIVHGHDDAMKQAVARVIEKLGLQTIILHEKPNKGKTIIEKFTEFSNVGFAIVLLSPDDVCLSLGGKRKTYRSRQNVIFELGFFIGKLGRKRVVSLFRQNEGFEFPSDYSGMLFLPFDEGNKWEFELTKELQSSGYEVDANKLLK